MGDFKVILFFIIFSSSGAYGDAPLHGFTSEEVEWMAEQNQRESEKIYFKDSLKLPDERSLDTEGLLDDSTLNQARLGYGKFVAFGEYKSQGYILFSDGLDFNSFEAKVGFLKHLPAAITPVIFTLNQSPEYINSLRQTYSVYLRNPSKLKIMYLRAGGQSFWARDGIPVPGFYEDEESGERTFTVIDAKYYHKFEADDQVARHFNSDVWSHDYYFEGGNFMTDESGNCLVVNTSSVKSIPNNIFEDYYGCTNLIRLPHTRGIGHVDESIKFVDEKAVLTDVKKYRDILIKEGFDVFMMPRARGKYETYLNSVILGTRVYVPSYGNELDLQAVAAYKSLGYDPILLDSVVLSNNGMGSLHCISMVYPQVRFDQFLKATGAELIK